MNGENRAKHAKLMSKIIAKKTGKGGSKSGKKPRKMNTIMKKEGAFVKDDYQSKTTNFKTFVV